MIVKAITKKQALILKLGKQLCQSKIMNNKMSKKFILSLLIIIILLTSSVWAFILSKRMTAGLKFDYDVINLGEQNSEKINIKNLLITETKDYQKYWEVFATAGNFDSKKSNAKLKKINGNFYKDDKVILSFKAPKAIYNRKSREITLIGGVKAATNKNVYITADKMTWIGDKKEIEAEGNVFVNQNNTFISKSDKAIFDAAFTKFRVYGQAQTKVFNDKLLNKKESEVKHD